VILPACPAEKVMDLANSAIIEVSRARIAVDAPVDTETEETIRYAVSIGLALSPSSGFSRPGDFEDTLRRADTELYKIKESLEKGCWSGL
jgi:GGDEF domain-containing protein